MATALIGLGSNVGDRRGTLARAVELIAAPAEIQVAACSRWHATAPVGGPEGQGEFLNGSLRLKTSLSPPALHELLRQVEHQLGRTRTVRWDERTIDLDLLLYDVEVLDTPELTVPHPSMAFRRFVLEPAAEVAPKMLHPILGWTVTALLEHLNTAASYAAIAGFSMPRKRELAHMLADRFDRALIADPCAEELAAALANPASLTQERQLEFLDRRVQAIARSSWSNWPRWTISDFWIGEFSAYWMHTLGNRAHESIDARNAAAQLARVQQPWREALTRAMPPKLVIVVEPDKDFLPVDAADRWLPLLASQQGPALTLRSYDLQQQFAEASAALQAMS